MNDRGSSQGSFLISVSGPTPVVRSTTAPPSLPHAQLNLLSVPAYVLGVLWLLAAVVWRANPLAGSRVGSEFLRFARPTVSATAVLFDWSWPDVQGLTAVTQGSLLVALVSSLLLAVFARLTGGRASALLFSFAALAAGGLVVAIGTVLTSGLPLSDIGAGLLLQVSLLVALGNGAWHLQRQLVVVDTEPAVRTQSVVRGVDRVASAVFFVFVGSVIGPVWIGRWLLGADLRATAAIAPESVAARLFNGASPWFFAYGVALASVAYAAVLLVPPYKDRGRLVALGCVLGVLAVGPGLTTIGEQARAASAAVAQQVRATPISADQLGWVCATWVSPDQPGLMTTWQGDGCRQLVTYEGQVKVSELSMTRDLYNDTAIPSPRSNSLNAGTGFLYGAYGATFVTVADSPTSAGGHVVVAYDMNTATEAWSFTCPPGSASFGIRFSGTSNGDEPSVNRETLELFGLLEYVAVDCGAGMEYVLRTDGSIVGQ